MVIGFLINTCEPFYRGGYERRAWTFARELVRQGHEVRIYTSCTRNEIIEGVHFIRLAPPRRYFNARGVRNGWADLLFVLNTIRLFWKLRTRELDVLDVCATPFLYLLPVAILGRIKKIPLVLTCHEALLKSLPAYARERGHASPLESWVITQVLAMIYRIGMGLFPRRLAVSHRTATALEKEGYPAQATVEFGLEPEVFSPQPPEAFPASEPVRFIYCGRLTPIKNVMSTIVALSPLKEIPKAFRFDIVGEGSERPVLEQAARNAGLETRVTFHGEVSEQTKRDLLARSEIFILSSPREGFSIATLEAMAQGCGALVLSDPQNPNGALDFVHHEQQGLVVSSQGLTLSDALQLLIEDAPRRLTYRRAAWQAAQAYRVETQAQKLIAFYKRL